MQTVDVLAILAILEILEGIPMEKPNGSHSHECPSGHVWSHANTMAGNEQAHMCPTCGIGPIWRRR